MAWNNNQPKLKWKSQNVDKLPQGVKAQFAKACKALEASAIEVASFRQMAEPLGFR